MSKIYGLFSPFHLTRKRWKMFSRRMCCSNSTLCLNKIFNFEDTGAKRAGAKGNRSGFVEIFEILTLLFHSWIFLSTISKTGPKRSFGLLKGNNWPLEDRFQGLPYGYRCGMSNDSTILPLILIS